MKVQVRPFLAGLAIVPLLASVTLAQGQGKAPAPTYAKVDGVLKAKCVGCHQGARAAAGVNLSSYDNVTKGKFRGKPLVVAKNPSGSVLVNAVHGTGMQKMPPNGSLPAADVKAIEAWIAAGAKK